MRIAFVTPAARMGGAERSLLDLMIALRSAEPELRADLVSLAEGPLVDKAREESFPAHVLPMPRVLSGLGDSGMMRSIAGAALSSPAALLHSIRLRRLLNALRPDIVHSNGNKAHALTALSRPRDSTLVWHIRDFIGARSGTSRALRGLAPRASGALANSRAVAADAQRWLGSLPVEVVYNGIDLSEFHPGPAEGEWLDRLCGMAPAPSGTIRLGLVATFAHWKGHDLFLRAAALARAATGGARLRFYIVGGPIYETRGSQLTVEDLRSRARGLGVEPCLGIAGFQADVARSYRSLDIVVHASTQPEPFGRTIVEAMACGRPVIASRAGGAEEIFTEGVDALGFRPGDADDLCSIMLRLAADGPMRDRLSQAGLRTARSRFSRETMGSAALAALRLFRMPGRAGATSRPRSFDEAGSEAGSHPARPEESPRTRR